MSKIRPADTKQDQPDSDSIPPSLSTESTSIFSRLKAVTLPYFQLMRLDRPNGYWYFWIPHVCGTLLASIQTHAPPLALLRTNGLLLGSVLIMRGATCTWNDSCDADYDRRVSRCRTRPIARGAVSRTQANLFALAQTALCVAVLAVVMPPLCALYAVPGALGWLVYPLAKRVTYYPQVVLGVPMAWGVVMGAAAMGADPLRLAPLLRALQALWLRWADEEASSSSSVMVGDQFRSALAQVSPDPATAALYVANVLWTLCYELVYSHQDAPEDAAAGVKNLIQLYYNPSPDVPPAERFSTKPLLAKLAMGVVICLAITGRLSQLGLVWEVLGVAGCAAGLGVMIATVRLEQPESCAWWFKVGNVRYVGGGMVGGLVGAYALQWIEIMDLQKYRCSVNQTGAKN